jgi:hypothetical protein
MKTRRRTSFATDTVLLTFFIAGLQSLSVGGELATNLELGEHHDADLHV